MQGNPRPSEPPETSRLRPWLYAGVPALLTFLVYLPTLQYPFMNWDDPKNILNNPHIRSLSFSSLRWMFTHFYAGFYTPLTLLSQALDYRLVGLDPFHYHLTNLFLHVVNTILVFFAGLSILRRARVRAGSAWAISAASLCALFFGLHPLHVEPVVWATGRKDVLCGFFFLLSLLAYLRYATSSVPRMRDLHISLALFVMALLSKPMAITLPLIFLLLDGWPLGRLFSRRSKAILEKLPFFAVALAFGLLSLSAESHQGAVPDLQVFPWDLRIMNAFHSLVFYLEKMLWPAGLAALYPMTGRQAFSIGNMVSVPLVVLAGAACWVLRRKRPYLALAGAFYLVMLLPVLGILQVGGHAAADRYAYLPTLAPFLLAAAFLADQFAVKRKWFWTLSLGLALVMGAGTVRQSRTWKDPVTLWENVTRVHHSVSGVSYSNLGDAYREAGRLNDALAAYDLAIRMNPDRVNSQNGRATVLFNMGRLDEALAGFKAAVAVDPGNVLAHYNLGFVYLQMDMKDEALRETLEAIRVDPGFAQAYNNLGVLYGSTGRFTESFDAFQKAVSLDPGNPVYQRNLAASRQQAGEGKGTAAKSVPLTMTNPASVNCLRLGGRSEIRSDAEGNQTGYCRFPDGRLCEEWALFREGKCIPPKK